MHYTKFIPPLLITGGILLVPFIAMFFTEEVQWTLSDFVIMGALIFGISLAYQFLSGRSGDVAYKGGIGLALLSVFLLVWINLAVGIIGSEDNPLNMLYLLIPMIGFVGTIIAKARAQGMYITLMIMAVCVGLVPIIGIVWNRPAVSTPDAFAGFIGVIMINALFIALFVGSGFLFKNAQQKTQMIG